MQANKKQKKQSKSQRAGRSKGQSATNVPAAKGFRVRNVPASLNTRTSGDGRVIVKHREFIADLETVQEFKPTLYPINPGLRQTFRWLSHIAEGFDHYIFRSLSFSYVPTVPTTKGGAISMAIDYDAVDAQPPNRADMMAYKGAVMCAPYAACTMRCDARTLSQSSKFIRHALVPGTDLKTYDLGNLIVNCAGEANYTYGTLFVDYVVELSNPHVPADVPWLDSAKVETASATKAEPLTGATYTNPEPTEPVVTPVSTTRFKIEQPGEYLFNLFAGGTGLDGNHFTIAAVGDAQATATRIGWLDTATAKAEDWLISCIRPCVYALTSAAAATTVTSMRLRAAPYQSALS